MYRTIVRYDNFGGPTADLLCQFVAFEMALFLFSLLFISFGFFLFTPNHQNFGLENVTYAIQMGIPLHIHTQTDSMKLIFFGCCVSWADLFYSPTLVDQHTILNDNRQRTTSLSIFKANEKNVPNDVH